MEPDVLRADVQDHVPIAVVILEWNEDGRRAGSVHGVERGLPACQGLPDGLDQRGRLRWDSGGLQQVVP